MLFAQSKHRHQWCRIAKRWATHAQIAIAASGEMTFVAGQIALDPSNGEIVGVGGVAKLTKQVIANDVMV